MVWPIMGAVTPAIQLLSSSTLRLVGNASHIKNDFLRNLPTPHLEDVDKTHFDVAAERKMPITVFHNIEGHAAVIDNPVLPSRNAEAVGT
jgi:hypothetical protein